MPARLHSFSIVDFQFNPGGGLTAVLGGGNLKDFIRDLQIEAQEDKVESNGLSAQFDIEQTVKRGLQFKVQLERPKYNGTASVWSAHAQCNLDVAAYTVAGTSFLGDLRSGSLKMSTKKTEGSGLADLYKYPTLNTRRWEIDTDLFIPSSSLVLARMTKALSSSEFDSDCSIALTLGKNAGHDQSIFTAPMTQKSITHGLKVGDVQGYKVSFGPQGAPTTPASPDTSNIWEVALAGGALGAIFVDSATGKYGTSIAPLPVAITDASISFADSQILMSDFTFEVQGTPTYATD